jgi:hypothetical protein
MMLRYGFHPSPFGMAVVITSERGLAGLAFADEGEEIPALADMQRRWPLATYIDRSRKPRRSPNAFSTHTMARGPAAARGVDRH